MLSTWGHISYLDGLIDPSSGVEDVELNIPSPRIMGSEHQKKGKIPTDYPLTSCRIDEVTK